MDDLTFVVFGDDWGRHVSSIQHVFRRLTGRADVIWIDSIGHRTPRLTRRDIGRAWEKARAMVSARRDERGSALDGSGPRVVSPRVLPWHSWGAVRRLNGVSLEWQIRRALPRGIRPGHMILVTNSPPSVPVVGRLGERASIYFCMDDYLTLPGTSPRMLAPLEKELLSRVDAVVATARALLDRKRCRTGRGYYLPQGVNYDHFATPRAAPTDVERLARPIIGFAGGVGTALDAGTLERLADAFPQGTVALVGPVHAASAVPRRPNVIALGQRSYADLPAYVQAFDVGIIPYVDNEWTRAVDPLKLLEYLAAGIPVVAAPLPEVDKYASVVSVAALGQPFVDAVRAAVSVPDPSARDRGRAAARANGWEVRAERFLEIVRELLKVKRPVD